jgi:hypothetical protein
MIWALLLLAADPQPRVQVEVAPKGGVLVGQRVTLAITLSTPDLFAGAPSFDMPAIPGCVVIPPAGSPVIGSETADGTSFTTQRHEFAIYPERPGSITVPTFPIRFESNAGFGKPTVPRRVTTSAVSFTAKSPPGADGLGLVVAARNLKVTETWSPEPHAAKVGDAFVRTVTIEADDVPGMVLPPLKLDAVEGLKAYAKPPNTADHSERGRLTGRRTETVTYICDRPGSVSIPARTLTWWDLDGSELRSEKLRGASFKVDGAAAPIPAPPPVSSRTNWLVPTLVALFAFACAARLWAARHRIVNSERASFARLAIVCLFGREDRLNRELQKRLMRHDCSSLEAFGERSGDPKLQALLARLQRRAFGRSEPEVERVGRIELLAKVRQARRRLLRRSVSDRIIPDLNPG